MREISTGFVGEGKPVETFWTARTCSKSRFQHASIRNSARVASKSQKMMGHHNMFRTSSLEGLQQKFVTTLESQPFLKIPTLKKKDAYKYGTKSLSPQHRVVNVNLQKQWSPKSPVCDQSYGTPWSFFLDTWSTGAWSPARNQACPGSTNHARRSVDLGSQKCWHLKPLLKRCWATPKSLWRHILMVYNGL